MKLLTAYRRLLLLLALLAVGTASLCALWLSAWRSVWSIASLTLAFALATGALLARRGRLWRPMVLLAVASGAAASVAFGIVPWLFAIPAGLGVVAYALLTPAMFRRDRLAALLATVLSVGLGVQAAAMAEEAMRIPHEEPLVWASIDVPEVEIEEPTDDYLRGVRDAQRDIDEGRLRLLTFGYPAAWWSTYRQALAVDGIELDAVAGCVVTGELVEHVRGYNAVMEPEIARRFGERYLEVRQQAARDAMEFGVY